MLPQGIGRRRRSGPGQLDIPLADLKRSLGHATIESPMQRASVSGNLIPELINRDIQKDANLRNRSQLSRQILDLFQQVR